MELAIPSKQRLLEALSFLLPALCLYVAFCFFRIVSKTYNMRRRYIEIPQLPRHPVWGNLIDCGERLAGNRHPDYGFEEIWESLGRPSCFLMDLSPVDNVFLILAEPQIADTVVHPSKQFKYSVPKSDTFIHLSRLIGLESLITQEGEDWKALRKRFNPGFQPKHIYSLTSSVISKTRMFVDKLKQAADNGSAFTLANYASDLTTDIITQLTIERDLHAQSTPEGQGEKGLLGMLTASRQLSELAYKNGQGLRLLDRINLTKPLKAMLYEYVFDKKLSTILSNQMHSLLHQDKSSASTRSMAQLAMANVPPSASLVRNTVHQIKTFLFAGQDTTATLVQWLCYEMSKNADVLSRLRQEHDLVFGPPTSTSSSAADILSQPGEADRILGSQLPYTTAMIKETLRLHPPAATARLIPFGASFDVEINGKLARLDGLRVYPCQWLIHRNPAIWGPDAHTFRPDRWLDAAYMAKLPAGAFRAFEHGPRNCIGQDLAMVEAKVVLVMVARGFAFEKIGLTGENGEEEVYNNMAVTSKPCDGMRMKVKKVA